jgi:hypothetical protein
MPSSADMTPVTGSIADYMAADEGTDGEDSGLSMGELINERRARSENPEGLRLARAL